MCARYRNFRLIKVDDDVALNPLYRVPRERTAAVCDRARRKLNTDKPQNRYYVGSDVKLHISEEDEKATICLGYFWYLGVAHTERFCNYLNRLVHYEGEDVSYSELFEELNITFSDFTSVEIDVPPNW